VARASEPASNATRRGVMRCDHAMRCCFHLNFGVGGVESAEWKSGVESGAARDSPLSALRRQ
jgi:hypothetical protein